MESIAKLQFKFQNLIEFKNENRLKNKTDERKTNDRITIDGDNN